MTGLLHRLRRSATRRLRRTFLGGCAVFFVDNLLSGLRLAHGRLDTESGAAHATWDVEESLRYIRLVHREYLEQAGIPGFFGRVVEVGPGDNSGVGLLMLADGAEQVELIDRFYSKRDLDHHKAVYERLKADFPGLRSILPADFDGERCDRLVRLYGAEAASETFFQTRSGYDFIVSRAVMEHVREPIASLHRMIRALKPGGRLLHAVDLRDHGMFTDYGFPELTFLRAPPWFYRHMADAAGRPNRILLSRYRKALPAAEFKVTSLVGHGALDKPTRYEDIPLDIRRKAIEAVRGQRHALHPAFRDDSDEDLSVSGFFLIFRKPASDAEDASAPVAA